MSNVPTWISRVSAIALATASISAFAAAPGAPEYLMHKASVKLKTSEQGVGEIETDTVKTSEVVNLIMGRPLDTKLNGDLKNETLGLVTGCAADEGAVALVVYDKKEEVVLSSPERAIVLDIEADNTELNNKSELKKGDLLAMAEDGGDFLYVTGQVKYGKIGNKVAKVDKVQVWDKNSICAKNFKTKSITGLGIAGDIIMSGKINAGGAQFGSDGNIFPGVVLGIGKAVNSVDNGFVFVTAAGDIVSYDIDVTNAGTQQVTGLSVTDALADAGVTCNTTILNVNQTAACTSAMTVTQAQIDTACGPNIGQGPATIENLAVANVNETNSSFATNAFVAVDCDDDGGANTIAIGKESDVQFATVGTAVTYTIDVQNLTGGALTGVTVSDTDADSIDCGSGDGTIGPMADNAVEQCTAVNVVTQADVDLACVAGGSIRNIATVTSNETNTFAADDLVGVACPK